MSSTPPSKTQTSEQGMHLYLRNRVSTFAASKITPQDIVHAEYAIESGDVLSMAEIMMKMAHEPDILAPFMKRIVGINALPFSVQPPDKATKKEIKQTEIIADTFEKLIDLPQLLLDLCSGIMFNISMLEIADPNSNDNKSGWKRAMIKNTNVWYPTFTYRPPSWFTTNPNNRNEIRLRNHTMDGQEIDPEKWVMHRHPLISGGAFESGILRQLVWTYVRKEYSEEDWSELLEKLGVPPLFLNVPSGLNGADMQTAEQAIRDAGHAMRGIKPESTKFEMLEAASLSGGNPFLEHINLAKQSYEELILGFSTSDAAQHAGQIGQNIINKATYKREKWDTQFIQRTINTQPIPMMMKYNFGITDIARMPKFIIDPRPVDISGFGDAILKLVQSGVDDIPKSWVHDYANIPTAGDGEEVLVLQTSKKEKPEPEPEPENKQEQEIVDEGTENPENEEQEEGLSVALAKKPNDITDTDEIDVVAENAATDKELMSSMINPFLEKIQNAKSYADIDLESVLDESNSHAAITNDLALWYFTYSVQGRLGIEVEPV